VVELLLCGVVVGELLDIVVELEVGELGEEELGEEGKLDE